MSKATAVAHPIQGLLKYHGLRDKELRLPMHDSISVCTAPFETRTTVELRDDLSAARLRLQLSLMYPGCKTVSDLASDYEAFKSGYTQYDFGVLEPERIDLR